MTITIPAGYEYVLISTLGISFQIILQGFGIGKLRRSLFGTEFFKTNFPKLDAKTYQGGYPDMGNGRFAEKLSFEDWAKFNNYQRAHYNYVEGGASALALLLVSGLFFPNAAAITGGAYILGRAAFAWGYRSGGPKARLPGALVLDAALVTWLGLASYGLFQYISANRA
eukprot:TRINITY_DN15653_c0_g1_i1.p1 TRINITY_DN15653_c0_g1~~TRINITY_DN15653_c0_g1_i1.p1  ORF type:complete len:169 (-),score=94.70 TRINITY_DN15653_c0_g1_i1:78-584(-)